MRARTPNQAPPRLHKTGDNWYWKPERKLRPKWRSAALGAIDSLAFSEARRLNKQVAEWLKAQADGAPAQKRKVRLGPATIGQLIAAYKVSEDWRDLRDKTRESYAYELMRLEREFGHEIAATLDEARVDDWLAKLRRTSPATARNVLAKGRLLFPWAKRANLIARADNPFKGTKRPPPRKVTKLSIAGRRRARFSWDNLRLLVAFADAKGLHSIGTALVLCFACVQRISDVIRLTSRDIVSQPNCSPRLQFAQSKTGFEVDMEVPSIVLQRLAAHPPAPERAAAGKKPQGWLIVSESTSAAYHEKTISRVAKRLVDALVGQGHKDLAGHQLRDGRRSGFVQYIMDGASVPFVCSMSGHSIEEGFAIVEHYLPKTPEQADRAVALLSVKWGA